MDIKLISRFRQFYQETIHSIAFVPAIIALGIFLFTGLMLLLETWGLSRIIEAYVPFLLVKNWEVAQSILTTLVAALISLMVFSFTMVMVMLNNASSNYSPRLLPGLIDNKFHQIVLGIYLGSIIYCLILAINATPETDVPLPGFSILVGIVLGVVCLALFIFFIHSISQSVQISNILYHLYEDTRENLSYFKNNVKGVNALPEAIEEWTTIRSNRSGYLKSILTAELKSICIKKDIKVYVTLPTGMFLVENLEVFKCSKAPDEDTKEALLHTLEFSKRELPEEDDAIGFKLITEIAVKAMSPGINDPGTALMAIDYLTILFSIHMSLARYGCIQHENENGVTEGVVWYQRISFSELIYFVLAALRQYSKHDVILVLKLLEMMRFLHNHTHEREEVKAIIAIQANTILKDAEANLGNPFDQKRIKRLIARFPSALKKALDESI